MFQDLNPLDKPTAVAEIVIMLLVAALFGFFISWLLQKFNTDRLKAEIRFLEGKYGTIQKKHDALEKENRELMDNLADLRSRKDSLLKELDDLKQDNEFIQAKFKNLSDTSHWTDKISILESTIASLKSKNEELRIQLVEEHHTAHKVSTLMSENESLKAKIHEENNVQLKTALTEEIHELSIVSSEEVNTEETDIDENLKEEPIAETIELIEKSENEVIQSTQEEAVEFKIAAKNHTSFAKNTTETHVFTKEELTALKQKLMANVGESKESKKNNLSKINGIGPLIEAKLNSIGIYTFEQVSRFNEDDIDAVTHLIEFFPGRIERDKWVQQAKDLV
jgi:predicted flap endonuclease-1-like 5' DNA nuclease